MSDLVSPLAELTASLDGPADAPVLVLGPSLGTSQAVWDRQVPALASRFRLLRFELPGHGGAQLAGHGGAPSFLGSYSVAGLGAGVRALLDEHGIERAAYCGISLGGMIGMWLAATAPERISALGLICTSAYLPPASGWLDRAEKVTAEGMASISEQSVGRWFVPRFIAREPDVAAQFATDLERIDPAGYAGCCAAIAEMDLRDLLGDIRAPVLVIAGADDPATPPPHGALIATRTGGGLRVIRGAAHLANVAAPGEVTALLLAHLSAARDFAR
jgi:3-oxoadipate enol-lactonase